jgi:hypothetical protein
MLERVAPVACAEVLGLLRDEGADIAVYVPERHGRVSSPIASSGISSARTARAISRLLAGEDN